MELPPFISIVRYPGRPVILGMENRCLNGDSVLLQKRAPEISHFLNPPKPFKFLIKGKQLPSPNSSGRKPCDPGNPLELPLPQKIKSDSK